MTDQLLRLDPSLSLCWEDPHTLRFGFDRATARLHDPSPRAQRLISALRPGFRRSHLRAVLERAGATSEEWSALVAELGPALVALPEEHTPEQRQRAGSGSAAVDTRLGIALLGADAEDPSPCELAVGTALELAGYRVHPFAERMPREPDLVVVLERFIAPQTPLHARAGGYPQLGIRFGDLGIRVGPLAATSGGPCLSCATLSDAETDPALPVMSAQLLGARPPTEHPAAGVQAAALAIALIRLWEAGSELPHRTRWFARVDAEHPEMRADTIAPHPECGCAAINAVRAVPVQR